MSTKIDYAKNLNNKVNSIKQATKRNKCYELGDTLMLVGATATAALTAYTYLEVVTR